MTASIIYGFVTTLALLLVIMLRYREKRRNDRLRAMQNALIEEQSLVIEQQRKTIGRSVVYAEKIQRALLASEQDIDQTLKRLARDP